MSTGLKSMYDSSPSKFALQCQVRSVIEDRCIIVRENVYLSESLITLTDYQKIIYLIRSGDCGWFPPQPPGSLVMWGTEYPKFDRVIEGK